VLYGRDAERALIGALLDRARASRSGTLVLRGEPGVGKTALLEDARERAADMHVLTARGVESESELPFAGLHQLTRPALHLLPRLPSPQAGALRGALALAERTGDDRFLISAACLTLLAELAERRPVLCLVDDAQWLDRSSTDALLFVARRLDAEGVVMLFAAREDDGHRFEARGLRDLELSGLDERAAAALIGHGVGGAVAAPVRDLLIEQADGNALALVELPAALTAGQLAGAEPLPPTLPLSRDVERLFLERLRRLPDPSQRLLTVIAADADGRVAPVMQAAAALGLGAEALTPAERAGLVSVRGSRLELRHPLVRSAVYQSASSQERRAAHRALADALGDDADADQRAWHLAAAALGPDAAVAAELERTAERARLRSGHAAAASALERASELSEDAESSARRLVAAAGAAWQSGRPERATALLDRASPVVSAPRVRAELDHVRGVIEWRCGALPDAAVTLMAGAADVGQLDSGKAVEMLCDAGMAALNVGDYARVAEAGQRAAALPRSDDERGFLAELLAGVGSLTEGKTAHEAPRVLDSIARARDLDDARVLNWAAVGASVVGDEATEATLLRRAVGLARASGAVETLTLVLETVAVSGLLAGRYAVAAEAAAEGLALAREAGLPNTACIHLASLAWLAGLEGLEDECRGRSAEVAEAARASGLANANSLATWGVALLDLSTGHADATVARLVALSTAPLGVGHPFFILMAVPDLVEAYVRTSRQDEARAAFAALEGFARAGAPAWALGLAARCRGLLAEGAEVEGGLTEAVRLHTKANRPFDRARTELLLGEHLRRERKRVAAREHLRAALEAFDTLGAQPWAERARAELRASGATARKRDPSTLAQLTPQELQVARFVGEGLSNKEVAAQLFLSPRTIDAHLRSVFAKLEITSRTQLARVPLGADERAAEARTTALPRDLGDLADARQAVAWDGGGHELDPLPPRDRPPSAPEPQ
jgi:DNA-binding CsgD family transcriptional regulator